MLTLSAPARHGQAKCMGVKHEVQRIARECPDVMFVRVETDGSAEPEALVKRLGVRVRRRAQGVARTMGTVLNAQPQPGKSRH
jgi:hypothetical protein